MGTAASWTPERRRSQSEAIRRWKPWEQSTGPKSHEGKTRSSKNAGYTGPNAKEFYRIKAELAEAPLRLQLLDCMMKRTGKRPFSDEPYPARPMSPAQKVANEAKLARLWFELESRKALRTYDSDWWRMARIIEPTWSESGPKEFADSGYDYLEALKPLKK